MNNSAWDCLKRLALDSGKPVLNALSKKLLNICLLDIRCNLVSRISPFIILDSNSKGPLDGAYWRVPVLPTELDIQCHHGHTYIKTVTVIAEVINKNDLYQIGDNDFALWEVSLAESNKEGYVIYPEIHPGQARRIRFECQKYIELKHSHIGPLLEEANKQPEAVQGAFLRLRLGISDSSEEPSSALARKLDKFHDDLLKVPSQLRAYVLVYLHDDSSIAFNWNPKKQIYETELYSGAISAV